MKIAKYFIMVIFFSLILGLFPKAASADFLLYPHSANSSDYSPNKTLQFEPDEGGCTGSESRDVLEWREIGGINTVYLRGTVKCAWRAATETAPSTWYEVAHSTCAPGCTQTHFIGQTFNPARAISGAASTTKLRVSKIQLGWFVIGDQYGAKDDPVKVRVSVFKYSGNQDNPRGDLLNATEYTFAGGAKGSPVTINMNDGGALASATDTLYLEIKQVNFLFDDHIIWVPVHSRWTTSNEHKEELSTSFDNGNAYPFGNAYAGNVPRDGAFREAGDPIYTSTVTPAPGITTTEYGSAKLDDDLGQITIWGEVFDAACESITPPSDPALPAGQIYAGKSYNNAVVQMKNTGNYAWATTSDFNTSLGAQDPQDNTNWGYNRVNLPYSPVNQNSSARFAFNVTAPAAPGTYNFNWQMVKDGIGWFGQKCTSTMTVIDTPITATGPKINSLKVNNLTSPSFTGSYKMSGRQTSEAGANWLNPLTITLEAIKGTYNIKEYYVAFYKNNLSGSTVNNFLANVQAQLNSDPKNGVLLRYDSNNKSYVWDPIIKGWWWLDATKYNESAYRSTYPINDLSGRQIYGVASHAANSWTVYWASAFGDKRMFTGAYVVDTVGNKDFSLDVPNIHQ